VPARAKEDDPGQISDLRRESKCDVQPPGVMMPVSFSTSLLLRELTVHVKNDAVEGYKVRRTSTNFAPQPFLEILISGSLCKRGSRTGGISLKIDVLYVSNYFASERSRTA